MNKDIFNSWMKNIDWEVMESKLMIRQDPTTREARKKLFKSIDNSGGGALDVAELKQGIIQLLGGDVPLGDELIPAVKAAFNAAKNLEKSTKRKKVAKGKKAKVGLGEFRAFLIAFKKYLELVELFEFLDGQGEDNQKLSLREAKRGVFLLAGWGITEEELEEKFKGVEAWKSHMGFKDFAEWCMLESGALAELDLDDSDQDEVKHAKSLHMVQQEHGVEMRSCGHGVVARESDENFETACQLFAKWDSDGNGSISEDELKVVLKALDSKMSDAQMSKLFAAADHNKDGSLDYSEFLKWLLA